MKLLYCRLENKYGCSEKVSKYIKYIFTSNVELDDSDRAWFETPPENFDECRERLVRYSPFFENVKQFKLRHALSEILRPDVPKALRD